MYPMAPGVCLIVAATPSFLGEAMNLSLLGQFTVVPAPGPFFQASLMALKCWVNTKVVPLLSARRTTVMSVSGIFASGLASAITGSLHFVTLPEKILLYASRESFNSLGPFG